MTKPSENYLSLAVIHCKYSLIYNLYLPAGESRKRAMLLYLREGEGGRERGRMRKKGREKARERRKTGRQAGKEE